MTIEDHELNLEKTTRVILIVGIIIVSSFIIYDITRPNEQFVLFSVLNQDEQLGNYPTQLHIGESITFYFYIENHLQRTAEFNVRMYLGNETSIILPTTGIANASLIGNYTQTLENNNNWTTNALSYTFDQVGVQFIGLELYEKSTNGWQYFENYTLFLRLNITV
jgi:uncharacterized membrane protein